MKPFIFYLIENKMLLVYWLNTIILVAPMWKQFKIITTSKDGDETFATKLLFFVFNITLLITMWLCYLKVPEVAWFFFLIGVCIIYVTYNGRAWRFIKKIIDEYLSRNQ